MVKALFTFPLAIENCSVVYAAPSRSVMLMLRGANFMGAEEPRLGLQSTTAGAQQFTIRSGWGGGGKSGGVHDSNETHYNVCYLLPQEKEFTTNLIMLKISKYMFDVKIMF